MNLTKEQIEQIRWILDPDNGHSNFHITLEMRNLFSELLNNCLFTSMDGYKIYEGDSIYLVSDSLDLLYTTCITKDMYDPKVYDRIFKDKESAEEEIERLNSLIDKVSPTYTHRELMKAVNNWAMTPISSENVKKFLDNEKRNT